MCFEGCFEGQEIDYETLVPDYQSDFARDFFENFLTPALERFTLGQGATPFTGPLTARASNPFVQGAMGLMAKSPYGRSGGNWGQMPSFGTAQNYPGATGWTPPGGGDGDVGYGDEPPFDPFDPNNPPFIPPGT